MRKQGKMVFSNNVREYKSINGADYIATGLGNAGLCTCGEGETRMGQAYMRLDTKQHVGEACGG